MSGCPGHLGRFELNSVSDVFIITFKLGEPGEHKTYFDSGEFGLIEDFMQRLKLLH